MARTLGEAFVRVRPDTSGFQQETSSGLSKGLRIAAAGIAAAFASKRVIDGAGQLVQRASDLSETGNKISVVFGGADRGMQRFARSSVTALGQTQQSALNAAATFGVFGKSAGLTDKENAKFSKSLVRLSSDMASFSNTTPEEAIEALGAGLRGESEPLRRYGVLLDDATLRNRALKMGLVETTKEALTPQQKVLAAQAEIMRQTSIQQGDFARTSGGLANQQRILSAQSETLKTTIGQGLLPVWEKTARLMTSQVMPPIVDMAEKHVPRLSRELAKWIDGVDLDGYFQRSSRAISRIDWSSLGDSIGSIGDRIAEVDWDQASSSTADIASSARELKPVAADLAGQLPGINDLLTVTGEVMGFAADNTGLLKKALPFLVAGFIATKVAQIGANAAQGLSIPLKIADIAATRAQTKAMYGFTAAQRATTGATAAGTVAQAASNATTSTGTRLTIRDRIAKVAHGVASRVTAAATWTMTVAQRALNLAMRANPIGIVITILAALAAAVVFAYKKSDTFRAIVDRAWRVIREGVRFAWERVIKPALSAFAGFLTNTLGPKVRWLWDRVIKPVMGWIGGKVRDVWEKVIKPAFTALKNFVGDKLAPAFRKGVDAIARQWNKLKGAAMAPVRFVIDTVINKGLIRGFNWISGKVGGPRIGYLPIPGGGSAYENGDGAFQDPGQRFASGGVLPGYTPGKDVHHFTSPTAGSLHLSGGEAIMRPEFTRAVGGEAGVARINKAVQRGLYHGEYASGGVFRPVSGSTSGRLHGSPPAIDIATPVGSTVSSVAAGRVITSRDLNGYEPRAPHGGLGYKSYGRYMEVLHNGFKTLYAHLSQRGLGVGAQVSGGQPIGKSGNTGYSFGPHVHFGSSGPNPNGFMNGTAGASSGGAGAGDPTGPAMPSWARKFLSNAVGWLEDKIDGGLGAISSKFGDNALSGLATAVPRKLVGLSADFLKDKINGSFSSASASGSPSSGSMNSNNLVPIMQAAMNFAKSKWGPQGLNTIYGYANRNIAGTSTKSDHAYGKALDFMTYSNMGLGDQIAGYFRGAGRGRFNVDNVIWRAPDHYDHVHIDTFDKGGLARGKGFLPKATIRPERMLDPRTTENFERLTDALDTRGRRSSSTDRYEMVITNWDTGRGYIRRVASDVQDGRRALALQYEESARG